MKLNSKTSEMKIQNIYKIIRGYEQISLATYFVLLSAFWLFLDLNPNKMSIYFQQVKYLDCSDKFFGSCNGWWVRIENISGPMALVGHSKRIHSIVFSSTNQPDFCELIIECDLNIQRFINRIVWKVEFKLKIDDIAFHFGFESIKTKQVKRVPLPFLWMMVTCIWR